MNVYARMSSGGLVCPVCDSTNVSVVLDSEKYTLGREGKYTTVKERIMHCLDCGCIYKVNSEGRLPPEITVIYGNKKEGEKE